MFARIAKILRATLYALPPETWVALLGLALVTIGVALWSVPAALVTCGALLLRDATRPKPPPRR